MVSVDAPVKIMILVTLKWQNLKWIIKQGEILSLTVMPSGGF